MIKLDTIKYSNINESNTTSYNLFQCLLYNILFFINERYNFITNTTIIYFSNSESYHLPFLINYYNNVKWIIYNKNIIKTSNFLNYNNVLYANSINDIYSNSEKNKIIISEYYDNNVENIIFTLNPYDYYIFFTYNSIIKYEYIINGDIYVCYMLTNYLLNKKNDIPVYKIKNKLQEKKENLNYCYNKKLNFDKKNTRQINDLKTFLNSNMLKNTNDVKNKLMQYEKK